MFCYQDVETGCVHEILDQNGEMTFSGVVDYGMSTVTGKIEKHGKIIFKGSACLDITTDYHTYDLKRATRFIYPIDGTVYYINGNTFQGKTNNIARIKKHINDNYGKWSTRRKANRVDEDNEECEQDSNTTSPTYVPQPLSQPLSDRSIGTFTRENSKIFTGEFYSIVDDSEDDNDDNDNQKEQRVARCKLVYDDNGASYTGTVSMPDGIPHGFGSMTFTRKNKCRLKSQW